MIPSKSRNGAPNARREFFTGVPPAPPPSRRQSPNNAQQDYLTTAQGPSGAFTTPSRPALMAPALPGAAQRSVQTTALRIDAILSCKVGVDCSEDEMLDELQDAIAPFIGEGASARANATQLLAEMGCAHIGVQDLELRAATTARRGGDKHMFLEVLSEIVGAARMAMPSQTTLPAEAASLARYHRSVGEALYAQAKFVHAEPSLQLAVSLDGSCAQANLDLAMCLTLGLSKSAEATPFIAAAQQGFRASLRQKLDNADSLHGLALCFMMQNKALDAAPLLEAAALAAPQNGVIMRHAMNCAALLKRPAQAAAFFAQAQTLLPNCPILHADRGAQLIRLGAFDEAQRLLRISLSINPDYTAASQSLALCTRFAAVTQNSSSATQQLNQAHKRLLDGHVARGQSALDNADFGSAIVEALLALELDPQSGEALHVLGHALLLSERLQEAEQALRQAVRQQPLNAHFMGTLFAVACRQKNWDKTQELYTKLRSGYAISIAEKVRITREAKVLGGFFGTVVQRNDGLEEIHWPDGGRYVGEVLNGEANGRGKFYKNGFLQYDGDFLENENTGAGTLFYLDGSRLEATWEGGEQQGVGRTFSADGRPVVPPQPTYRAPYIPRSSNRGR